MQPIYLIIKYLIHVCLTIHLIQLRSEHNYHSIPLTMLRGQAFGNWIKKIIIFYFVEIRFLRSCPNASSGASGEKNRRSSIAPKYAEQEQSRIPLFKTTKVHFVALRPPAGSTGPSCKFLTLPVACVVFV